MTSPAFAPPVQPDVDTALSFFTTLFKDGGTLHFRAVSEPADGRTQTNHHYQLGPTFRQTLAEFLTYCHVDGRAAYVLPGPVRGTGTGKADVLSLPAVLVDFDKGDPSASLAAAEELLGRATVVVESGGTTEQGHAKLHAHWALGRPATDDAIAGACRVRLALAEKFGGDPAFKQPAQVVRIPGSIHFKGTPKLVKLRAVRPSAVYELVALSRAMGTIVDRPVQSDNFFDLRNVVPLRESLVDRTMTAPIRAEGKDDLTRFEGAAVAIGHFIRQVREGRMTEGEAWEATRGWNQATLQPPWTEERLRNDFERLKRIDTDTNGPIIPASPVFRADATEGWALTGWRADKFVGVPPVRRWLVEGLIPVGTPGLFAAVGDAGKSMLALRLALVVSSYPTPATTADGPAGFSDTPQFFGQPILGRGAAVVLTAEDDADEVHRRINGLDPSNIRAGKPLYIIPLISTGGARAILSEGHQGPQPTPFWFELKAQLTAMPDLKLVVLDPLSSFVAADINKDNLVGAALMSMLAELAATTGAAVMLVHHFAKARVPENLSMAREAIRGAGALVDNGRWALVMWEADQDEAYRVLKALGQKDRAKSAGLVYLGGLAKGNAPGEKVLRTLVRNGSTGLLEDVTAAVKNAAPRRDEQDEQVLAGLRAIKTRHPRFVFAAGEGSLWTKTEPLLRALGITIGKKPLAECIQRLIQRGLVVEGEKPGQYEPSLD